MNKLESTIPFDGFYESFISADIENQIELDTEHYSELYDLNEFETELLCNSFLNINSYKFYNQIAEDYTNFYIDALNERLKGFKLKATYKCFESPREYNFKTDRIFIEIEENHAIDFIEHVVKNYKKELEKKIEDKFTSRSGFISFYKNSIDLWTKDFKEWDCNMIGTCFELFDLEDEDINYSLREYLSEIIMFNLRNTLDKDGIDLLDKKQKEKDKKDIKNIYLKHFWRINYDLSM